MSQQPDPHQPNKLDRLWRGVRQFWKPEPLGELDLTDVRAQTPAPVFWLFGKTQSGKTSIIRYLTGAEDAAIGNGFRPCTKTSRMYPFPTAEAPVLTFLDTRGLDEPSYDPTEDLAAFDSQAHLMIVTCRLRDFAHGGLRDALRKVRAVNKRRPVVLALTCLHESYPQEQHPQPYFNAPAETLSLIEKQKGEFAGLFDAVVPIDLTKPDEGFHDTEYGGAALKAKLVELLPTAYRETLLRLDGMNAQFKEIYLKRAIPVIIGYSTLAATAGAIPIPFVDLFVLPSIQVRMVKALAELSGSPGEEKRFLELSASIGIGLLARQAIRQVAKLIPYVGSAVGAGLAYSSTYALGRAFIEYDQAANAGHAPDAETIKKIYRDHLNKAENKWGPAPAAPGAGS